MDDSMILLPSSIYLKNIEELIKNLDDQIRQDIIAKSFSSFNNFSNLENFLIHSNKSQTSWRQMKESQRIINEIDSKETRSISPLNLYKIFQEKSTNTKSHLSTPTRNLSFNKSLPDLSFISHYSKELPPSPLLQTSSTSIARTTPSPTLIHQHKQDSDRPRTLKSIKRYKNSKHSTVPINIFYSPQLRKPLNIKSTSETDLTIKRTVNISSNDQLSSLTKRSRCQSKLFVKDHLIFIV